MIKSDRLLVPISLEILLTGKKGQPEIANCTTDYNGLYNGEVLGDSMTPSPFTTATALKPGAHLHWALPDAYTKGYQTGKINNNSFTEITGINDADSDKIYSQLQTNGFVDGEGTITRRFVPGQVNLKAAEGEQDFTMGLTDGMDSYEPDVIKYLQNVVNQGDIVYPATPVYWYVLRIHTEYSVPNNPKVSFKAWIVESHHITDEWDEQENRISIPAYNATDETFYRLFLGRKSEYENWSADKPENYLAKITAVGPGDPMFAAYYPSCRSVFGLHDPLTDIDPGKITYMVMGWNPDTEQDPLTGDVPDRLRNSFMQELNWSLFEKIQAKPNQVLCHGTVYNVDWKGADAKYSSGAPAEDPELTWGNNSVEALSTLIASKLHGEPKDVAKVLEAFNYDLLSHFDYPDGIAKVEEKLFEESFRSKKGGTEYVIEYPSAKDNKNIPDTISEFPGTIGSDLAKLNSLLRQQQEINAQLVSWQWETYSTWYKYISDRNGPGPGPSDLQNVNASGADYEKIIDDLGNKINQCNSQLTGLQTQIDNLKTSLQKDVDEQLPGYKFHEVNRDRFWEPNDPVLMFSGDGVDRSFRYGYDGQFSGDGTLKCRATGFTVTGINVDVNNDGTVVTLDKNDLLSYCNDMPLNKVPLTDELQNLIIETIILDTNQSELLAIAALKKSGIGDPTAEQVSALANKIKDTQTLIWNACLMKNVDIQNLASSGGLIGNVPDKTGFQCWSQAWVPLYMEWFVNVFNFDDIKPDFSNILSHWTLGDIDYSCTSDSPGNKTCKLQGGVIITPHAPHNLQQALDNYIQKLDPNFPELQELKDISKAVGGLNILSQSMSGFNNSLIMKKETIQFPVFDIPENSGGNPVLAKKVASLVGDMTHLSPSPEYVFNPIRSGFMNLIKLWLIDAFGQVKPIDVTKATLIPDELTTEGDTFKNLVTLKPRFCQPARLNFDWISADESTVSNSDPESNPVCGWLLPNHLDNSLMIYDQKGIQQGELINYYNADKSSSVRWVSAPGTVIQPPDIVNDQLKGFVIGLIDFKSPNGGALIELLENLDETLWTVDPLGQRDDQSLSVLIGRPLALANVSLGMEFDGLPSFNQSFDDLGKFRTQGFENVRFPARMGDISQICDGLMGYFIKDGGNTYSTFHATPGIKQKDTNSGYVSYDHTLQINTAKGYGQINLAMVIDPRAGVHITTGILPVIYKEISPAYISGALGNLGITFGINPLINAESKISVPLPAIDSSWEWKWISRPEPEKWLVSDKFESVNIKSYFSPNPNEISEGWLKLNKNQNGSK